MKEAITHVTIRTGHRGDGIDNDLDGAADEKHLDNLDDDNDTDKTMRRTIFVMCSLLVAAFSLLATSGLAGELTGRASVIDGDTIEIHGQRIRFFGIDAPESAQTCARDGKTYRCGQEAALALSDKIGTQTVACEQRDIDRYKRIVAVCRLGSLDLNGWIVSQGLAIAYRKYGLDYIAEEDAAKAARLGLWAGTFEEPSQFRQGTATQSPAPTQRDSKQDCLIKGNISAKGERIYHVPGGGYYDRTRIDTANRERWFCTEDEALAAGWRKSKR